DSVFTLLDAPAERDEGDYVGHQVSGAVSIRHLNFTYSLDATKPALHDINLNVAPREDVALVGRSGSGKSTLISLLARFYDFHDGEILIDGVSIHDYQLDNLRQHIALVNQQVVLFNDTVAANIAYGALATTDMAAIERAADAAYA